MSELSPFDLWLLTFPDTISSFIFFLVVSCGQSPWRCVWMVFPFLALCKTTYLEIHHHRRRPILFSIPDPSLFPEFRPCPTLNIIQPWLIWISFYFSQTLEVPYFKRNILCSILGSTKFIWKSTYSTCHRIFLFLCDLKIYFLTKSIILFARLQNLSLCKNF
jgi:hypothetical protein